MCQSCNVKGCKDSWLGRRSPEERAMVCDAWPDLPARFLCLFQLSAALRTNLGQEKQLDMVLLAKLQGQLLLLLQCRQTKDLCSSIASKHLEVAGSSCNMQQLPAIAAEGAMPGGKWAMHNSADTGKPVTMPEVIQACLPLPPEHDPESQREYVIQCCLADRRHVRCQVWHKQSQQQWMLEALECSIKASIAHLG